MKKISVALCVVLALILASCASRPEKTVDPEGVSVPEVPTDTVPELESSAPATKPEGISGSWVIIDADGWTAPDDGLNVPAMLFDENCVVITTSLNSMLTGYTVDMGSQTLTIEADGPMTLVAGSDHQMHFESALLKALPQVARFDMSKDGVQLYLFNSEGELLIELNRKPLQR